MSDDIDKYLNPETYGGYDAYRGVVRTLEIMRESDDEEDTVYLQLHGQKLANAFEKTISATDYQCHLNNRW